MKIFDIDNQKLIGVTDNQRAIIMLIEIFGDDCIDAEGDLCIKENEVFIFADYASVFEKRFKLLNI